MTAILRRARALALLASVCSAATLAACTGHNDGHRDGAGGSSMGAGGPAPEGPLPGQNTDTTMLPAATAGAASPVGSAASTPGAAQAGTPGPLPGGSAPSSEASKVAAPKAP